MLVRLLGGGEAFSCRRTYSTAIDVGDASVDALGLALDVVGSVAGNVGERQVRVNVLAGAVDGESISEGVLGSSPEGKVDIVGASSLGRRGSGSKASEESSGSGGELHFE